MLMTKDPSYDYIIIILFVVISWNEIFDFKEEGSHFVWVRLYIMSKISSSKQEMNIEDGVLVKHGSM